MPGPLPIRYPTTPRVLSVALDVKVTDLIAALTFKLRVSGKSIQSYLTKDEAERLAAEFGVAIRWVDREDG